MPRSTRRTAAATQPLAGRENRTSHSSLQRQSAATRKTRHRLSAAELARLEDVFKQTTHPSRQQKKDLAAELGMDYKTITIWFQNKRQTSKRGRPLAEGSGGSLGRTRADSCLRNVSSPSLNATLDASEVVPILVSPADGKDLDVGSNKVTSKAIVKIKPLLDSLNALASRPRRHPEFAEAKDEAPDVGDIDQNHLSESANAPTESDRHDQVAEQERTKGKPTRWKRIRTLEWACERQAKRRKLSREGYLRLGSEEVRSGDPSNTRVDTALSLLSLASLTQVGPQKDVVKGASLLLSFKHTWQRKEQARLEATSK